MLRRVIRGLGKGGDILNDCSGLESLAKFKAKDSLYPTLDEEE
jgi:hypothetical protein